MNSRLKNFAAAAGLAFATVFSASALAAPVFTVDPGGLGSAKAAFEADAISGFSTELLVMDAGTNTLSGSGWMVATSFALNGTPLLPGVTGLQVDYQLYVTFTISGQLTSGVLGQDGSTYALTSLDYQVWGDPNLDTAFFGAVAVGGVAPTVNVGNADILLGSGSLVFGTAALVSPAGAALNSLQTYANTAAGADFFVLPVPFYELAFTGFNNAGGGVTRSGDFIAINNASGNIDFLRIPEPGILGLLGLALAGVGLFERRRRQTAGA